MTGAHGQASVTELSRRIDSIPALLDVAFRLELPNWSGAPPRRVVTTGIGASEGPARLLASALRMDGIAAGFEPLADFACGAPGAELLVVFSQNLSPNARLALRNDGRFATRWLVTSVSYERRDTAREHFLAALRDHGVHAIVGPPGAEDGMLVRVVGPTIAALLALRLAVRLGATSLSDLPFDHASAAYASPVAMDALPHLPLSLIAAGPSVEVLHSQRWKLLEGLLRGDPPLWDVLQVAHGPLQSFHDHDMCLLALATPSALHLLERLRAVLVPERHQLIAVVSTRCDALSYFEHTAAIDACLLATLRARPRDLFDWPGRNADGPLYELGERPV